MLMHPKPGQRVRIHYAAKRLPMPHHAKCGTVVVAAGKGRGPKNHLVRMDDGTEVTVPAGNLNKENSANG